VTLGELVRRELEAHGADVDGAKVSVEGPPVALSSREVQVLALAVHELATNATKYGALSQASATLEVAWELDGKDGQPSVAIDWSERGVSMPSSELEGRRGFGRELIEQALPYDLGAETGFSFASDGVRCSLKVPLTALTDQANGEPLGAA
jgi:two-component sensor histidine kinase